MALSIKDGETERLARSISARRGAGLTTTIRDALRREDQHTKDDAAIDEQRFDIAVRRAQQMVRDGVIDWNMTKDELLGYDEYGIPENP